MLAIPLLVGLAASGRPVLSSLLILPATLLLFMARYAALPAATRLARGRNLPEGYLARRFLWSAIYLAGSGALLLAAVATATPSARGATLLVAVVTGVLGTTHAALALLSLDRTLWGELIGLTGLACSAALVMAAAGHPLDGRAWAVVGLCLGYFVTSVAYVRTYRARDRGERRAPLACIVVHVLVLAGWVALWRQGWLPAPGLVAFVPVAMRTAVGLWRPPANVRAVGWTEMGVATSFLVLAAVAVAS
jgi:hypothetical protein